MIKVNLLSPEKKEVSRGKKEAISLEEKRGSKFNVPVIIAAVAVTLIILIFLYFSQLSNYNEKVRILKDRKAKKTQLENVLKTLENLERIKDRLDKKVKIINQLKNRQKIVVKMMDDMSISIPDWVWLNSLNFSHGALTISGKALSNNLIADFIKNMQNTNHFSNVRINFFKRKKQSGLDIFNFSIKSNYVEKPIKREGE